MDDGAYLAHAARAANFKKAFILECPGRAVSIRLVPSLKLYLALPQVYKSSTIAPVFSISTLKPTIHCPDIPPAHRFPRLASSRPASQPSPTARLRRHNYPNDSTRIRGKAKAAVRALRSRTNATNASAHARRHTTNATCPDVPPAASGQTRRKIGARRTRDGDDEAGLFIEGWAGMALINRSEVAWFAYWRRRIE